MHGLITCSSYEEFMEQLSHAKDEVRKYSKMRMHEAIQVRN